MSENTFSIALRKRLVADFNFRFDRVESHATAPGIPDCHYICQGSTGWIEFKESLSLPKAVNYRPGQVPWLMAYSYHGGRCFTILNIKLGRYAIVIPGCESATANRSLKDAAQSRIDLCSGMKSEMYRLVALLVGD
jgi:hypothetical protein